MNGKFKHSNSLEGQLAAVAVATMIKVQNRINRAGDSEKPSASDFEEAFRVYVKIAELQIRLNERDRLEEGHADRRSELVQQLYRLKAEIPEEFQS